MNSSHHNQRVLAVQSAASHPSRHYAAPPQPPLASMKQLATCGGALKKKKPITRKTGCLSKRTTATHHNRQTHTHKQPTHASVPHKKTGRNHPHDRIVSVGAPVQGVASKRLGVAPAGERSPSAAAAALDASSPTPPPRPPLPSPPHHKTPTALASPPPHAPHLLENPRRGSPPPPPPTRNHLAEALSLFHRPPNYNSTHCQPPRPTYMPKWA